MLKEEESIGIDVRNVVKLNRGKEVILQVTKEFEEEIRFKTIIC